MKKKIIIAATTGMLAMAGIIYGYTTAEEPCPWEGTSGCPKVNCPLYGTPACPYEQSKTAMLPDCCKKH